MSKKRTRNKLWQQRPSAREGRAPVLKNSWRISKLGKYMKGYSVALLFNSGDCFYDTLPNRNQIKSVVETFFDLTNPRYSVVSQLDITHNFLV